MVMMREEEVGVAGSTCAKVEGGGGQGAVEGQWRAEEGSGGVAVGRGRWAVGSGQVAAGEQASRRAGGQAGTQAGAHHARCCGQVVDDPVDSVVLVDLTC